MIEPPIVPTAIGPKTVDFTSGYRNATKGATLKALQQRRADMAAQVEAAMKPREIASPWQGAAQIAGVVGGSIREARAANQEAAGRERFAELLAGGLAPDEIGEAMGLDPETAMKYQDQTWKREDDLTKHGWDVDAATKRVTDERETARLQNEFTASQTEDTQAHALDLQEKTQAATLVLADHNASIDEKKAAQKVIDDAEVAKTKVGTDRTAADEAATRASDLATQQAAQGDEMAKIALAEKAGYITPEVAQQRREAVNRKTRLDSQSPASKKFDTDSATANEEWVSVGRVKSAANKAQLDRVLKDLESFQDNNSVAGTISRTTGIGAPSGVITGLLPDSANRMLASGVDGAPDPVTMRENVRTVAQQSLVATLGAQFAAREGEDVMNRAYDPGATPGENGRRIGLLKTKLEQIEKYNDARAAWLAENQTMEGFTGPTPAEIEADFLTYVQSPEFTGTGGDTAAPDAAAPAGDPLAEAKAAIAKGADPVAVKKRLQEKGIDPSGL